MSGMDTITKSNRPGLIVFILTCGACVLVVLSLLSSDHNYSVQYNSATISTNSRRENINASAPCSFQTLQDHCKRSLNFPQNGTWVDRDTYQPSLCKFQYQGVLPKDYFPTCAVDKGISRISILGDSNGRRYNEAMVKLLELSGYRCRYLKFEANFTGHKDAFTPVAGYYAEGTKINVEHIQVHKRDCGGCYSCKLSCHKPGSALVFALEYLAMEFLVDTEVTTLRKYGTDQCPPPPARCLQSTTHQEFVFGEYLRDHYPDVIVLFGNHHDMRRKSLKQIKADMEALVGLIHAYVPKTTRVVWVGTNGENLGKKPIIWQNELYKLPSGKVGANGMIAQVNKVLFDVLQAEMYRGGANILPFLDIQAVSWGVLRSWNKDGVHMRPVWYEHIMSYILQTLCNSDIQFKV